MSCISNLDRTTTDVRNCNGTTMSSNPPSHQMSSQEQICLGINLPEGQSQSQDWENGKCQALIHDMVYPNGEYSKEGFENAVEDYNYLFYSYYGPLTADNPNGGHTIDEDDEYSNLLIDSCSKTQGVCQCAAFNMCRKCTSSQIIGNDLTRKFCGCFSINTVSALYGTDPNCDPLCSGVNTNKHRNFTTGKVSDCSQRVCHITDTDIGEFYNNCPQCRDGDCICYSEEILPGTFREVCNNKSRVIYEDANEGISSFNLKYFVVMIAVFIVVLLAFVITVKEEEKDFKEEVKVREDILRREFVKVPDDRIVEKDNTVGEDSSGNGEIISTNAPKKTKQIQTKKEEDIVSDGSLTPVQEYKQTLPKQRIKYENILPAYEFVQPVKTQYNVDGSLYNPLEVFQ